jgi:TQXA domain-containing protein
VKFKKIIISVISIMLVFCICSPTVFAISETFYSSKYMEAHWKWTSGTTGNNVIKSLTKDSNYYFNMGNASYCLDNGKTEPSTSGTTGTYTGYCDSIIQSILYHGYPNNSYDSLGATNAEVAYDATQLAIHASQGTLTDKFGAGLAQFTYLRDYNGNAVTVAKNILSNAYNYPYSPPSSCNLTTETHNTNVTVVGDYYIMLVIIRQC